MEHGNGALISAMGIIRVLVTFLVFAIAIVLILGNLAVNVAGLVAGLGVGGMPSALPRKASFPTFSPAFRSCSTVPSRWVR